VSEKGEALSLSISNPSFDAAFSADSLATETVPNWFAVKTRPRHEKRIEKELSAKGIASFLPVQRERRRWSDRYQWVEVPLFSQYLFVRLPFSLESRTRVLQTMGVLQFVGAPGRGTPIPDQQIETLQTLVAQRVPVTPHEFLRIGERVRIRGGALEGIEGILSEIRNDKSLVVSVESIQKSIAIRINGFEVEPA
jgi:transcription antitermination factor NusG